MRIAIDLDGTTMDFMGHWRGEYRKQFPEFELKPPTNGYFQLSAETHFEDEDEWWAWHKQHVGWANLPFLPNAVRVIKRLQKRGHEVEFITARPSYGWVDTRRQLMATFGVDVRLTFSSLYGHKAGCIESTIQHRFWPDLWIEDSPHEIMHLLSRLGGVRFFPWQVVVFDQPWNQHIEADHRITRWTQMNRIVKELE